MNPLEIYRRTPGSNCGRCGYPTCLAFAAAVAKTGKDPHCCADMELSGLDLGKGPTGGARDPAREHDLALIVHLQSKLALLDFSAIAAPLGARWDRSHPDSLYLSYLGREIEVSRKGVLIDGVTPADLRDQILLYNYVHSGGGRTPARNWIGLESLPNSISKTRTLSVYGEEPLARLFTVRRAEIDSLLRKVGGVSALESSASAAYVVPVLPMVPQFVLFWDEEPEEGFSARVKILFDRFVLDFLDLESLVFSAERLAERLIELAAPAEQD
jgi:hypothetical protein